MDTGTPSKRTRPRCRDNRTTTAFQLSDELWAVLEPVLPVPVNRHRFGGGRPRGANRDGADAIFYVLRTGCQWRALKQTTRCAQSTAHDRFQGWGAAGVCRKRWQTGVEQFEARRGLDGEWLRMDGAMTQAPWGGEKNGPHPDRSGQAGCQAECADGSSWSAAQRGRCRRQAA